MMFHRVVFFFFFCYHRFRVIMIENFSHRIFVIFTFKRIAARERSSSKIQQKKKWILLRSEAMCVHWFSNNVLLKKQSNLLLFFSACIWTLYGCYNFSHSFSEYIFLSCSFCCSIFFLQLSWILWLFFFIAAPTPKNPFLQLLRLVLYFLFFFCLLFFCCCCWCCCCFIPPSRIHHL